MQESASILGSLRNAKIGRDGRVATRVVAVVEVVVGKKRGNRRRRPLNVGILWYRIQVQAAVQSSLGFNK